MSKRPRVIVIHELGASGSVRDTFFGVMLGDRPVVIPSVSSLEEAREAVSKGLFNADFSRVGAASKWQHSHIFLLHCFFTSCTTFLAVDNLCISVGLCGVLCIFVGVPISE